jgi:hypothetical protein
LCKIRRDRQKSKRRTRGMVYKLTVFEKSGEKLLDEAFEAKNDDEAKARGEELLHQHAYEGYTYRCTSPKGKLVLFHV